MTKIPEDVLKQLEKSSNDLEWVSIRRRCGSVLPLQEVRPLFQNHGWSNLSERLNNERVMRSE